jgi:hypothetical protein
MFHVAVADGDEPGRAINLASHLDPAETHARITRSLESVPPLEPRRRIIDTR